jgi:CNT family concentrative nucleoside transporter
MLWERLISFLGIFFILGIAWLLSNNRKKINYRVIIWGLVLQISFAFIILKTTPGRAVFGATQSVIVRILAFTDEGASFMFGNLYRANSDLTAHIAPGNIQGHVLLLDSDAAPGVDLGATVVGERDTFSVALSNPGSEAQWVENVVFQDTAQFRMVAPVLPFSIPKKSQAELVLLFQPKKAGKAFSEIKIIGDSVAEAKLTVTAEGTQAPLSLLQVGSKSPMRAQFKELGVIFAFHILPTIIFFAALMSVLYHFGIIQKLVQAMAWIMARTMGTSGAESLSAASNIFVGQTEAPLVIKPYVSEMTRSELMAIMTGGFATIAGGVLAAYVRFGVDAGHLLAASVMSAPAALMLAKIIYPETEKSKTSGKINLQVEKQTANVIDAAVAGAGDGLRLAVNVGAMLMAFISLIAMLNFGLGHIDEIINFVTFQATSFHWNLSIKQILGYIFAPFSFFMGVSWKDILEVGNLLGTKISLNEFVAYIELTNLKESISPRSFIIATYALCGFANFSSIAIQIGGIGSIAPNRRSDLAQIGLKAMLGGALASWLTATIAGMLL